MSRKNLPRLKYPPSPDKQLASSKDARNMNRVTSGIAGALESMRTKMEILDREIQADVKGKKEYDDQLFRLRKRRADLEAKLNEGKSWVASFDTMVKPLEGKYTDMTKGMAEQYDDAKKRHAEGIQVLIENFDYHPEFKRFSDSFSAVPFRPK